MARPGEGRSGVDIFCRHRRGHDADHPCGESFASRARVSPFDVTQCDCGFEAVGGVINEFATWSKPERVIDAYVAAPSFAA
jgi:hypothetical protein